MLFKDASRRGSREAVSSGLTGAIKSADQHNKMTRKWNQHEMRARLAELKLYLMEGGLSDVQIQEMMAISVQKYNELKKELYRQENAELARKTSEDVYLEYQWAQQNCIKDIDQMLKDLLSSESKQFNAMVGCIRAKSEIIDKILQTGQSMGVISKAPERSVVIHGHAVVNMSNKELRSAIAKEMSGLSTAIQRYGELNMLGEPLEQAPPVPTMSIQEKMGMNMSGPTKAAAARASRKAVKRSKVIDVP